MVKSLSNEDIKNKNEILNNISFFNIDEYLLHMFVVWNIFCAIACSSCCKFLGIVETKVILLFYHSVDRIFKTV